MKYPRFLEETVRNQTFAGWRKNIDKSLLVQSGLFYLGGVDSTQCFSCGVVLHSWNEWDIPDHDHFQFSPTCEFIKDKIRHAKTNQLDLTSVLLQRLNEILLKVKEVTKKVTELEDNMRTVLKCQPIDDVDRIVPDSGETFFSLNDHLL